MEKEDKMNRYKVEVLRKEFSFIDDLRDDIYPADATSIKITKGDMALMSEVGSIEEQFGQFEGDCYENFSLYFAIINGKVLELKSSTWRNDHGAISLSTAPNIGEQLFTDNINPDYLVKVTREDLQDGPSYYWVIYKMKDFELAAYHHKQIDKAAAELKAEITAYK